MRLDGAYPDRIGGDPAAPSAGLGAGWGVFIVLGAKDGTTSGPGLRGVCAMSGLPDFIFCGPARRSVEAS
jgi:hypothetical protein